MKQGRNNHQTTILDPERSSVHGGSRAGFALLPAETSPQRPHSGAISKLSAASEWWVRSRCLESALACMIRVVNVVVLLTIGRWPVPPEELLETIRARQLLAGSCRRRADRRSLPNHEVSCISVTRVRLRSPVLLSGPCLVAPRDEGCVLRAVRNKQLLSRHAREVDCNVRRQVCHKRCSTSSCASLMSTARAMLGLEAGMLVQVRNCSGSGS